MGLTQKKDRKLGNIKINERMKIVSLNKIIMGCGPSSARQGMDPTAEERSKFETGYEKNNAYQTTPAELISGGEKTAKKNHVKIQFRARCIDSCKSENQL